MPATRGDRRLDQPPVPGQHLRVPLPQRLDQPGRPLDVGEHERHRPSRKRPPATPPRPAGRLITGTRHHHRLLPSPSVGPHQPARPATRPPDHPAAMRTSQAPATPIQHPAPADPAQARHLVRIPGTPHNVHIRAFTFMAMESSPSRTDQIGRISRDGPDQRSSRCATRRTKSAKSLAAKAMVLIDPQDRAGEIVWPADTQRSSRSTTDVKG